MASYFDIQPSSKATAEVTGVKDGAELKQMGMLTPQVSRILDDLGLEEHSSSDSEPKLSDDSDSHQQQQGLRKASTSPLPETKHVELEPPPQPGPGSSSGKQRHQHLARFHSLRSILFSSKIENKMAECHEERAKAEAEEKWRVEHDQRRGLQRQKTPDSPKGSPTKEGFAHRIGDKLKRITSKDVPTMKNIREDDNESTASDEDDSAYGTRVHAGKDSDSESIKHSDVEDLVRWISRRDPPSDGEARKLKREVLEQYDSGHESLGHSDVEDLVKWVNRNEPEIAADADVEDGFGYGEASTESDSEGPRGRKEHSVDDEDELMRWISRKEGLNAGPVHGPKVDERNVRRPEKKDSHSPEDTEVSDGGELARWITRKDGESGESDVSGRESISKIAAELTGSEEGRRSLAPHDVDELVRWVTNKGERPGQSDTENKTSGDGSPQREVEAPLTHKDVDELVKWVSRKD